MKIFDPLKIFKILIERYTHRIAKKYILKYPQIVILSFDHIGLKINLEGRYENHLLEILEKFIQNKIPNSKYVSALDIGANIGNHSIFFSNFFEKVYAFEPNPLTYEILKINSNYVCERKNISTYNYGLSNKKEKVYFRLNPSNIGGSRIISNEEYYLNNKRTTEIDVVCADELDDLKNINIGLIKIDVEGHEIKTLKGAEELIKKNKPIILFEQGKNEFKNNSSQVTNYLKTQDYIFYEFNKSFYFGENVLLRLLSLLLRSIFGNKTYLKKTSRFQKKHYELIIALPSKDLI